MAAPPPVELRREFLLDPEIAFLNHGSFGACPRTVFERYQHWQRELEREPIDFLDRRLPDLLADSRATLADYLGCAAKDLAFVQNATTGVNLAARSLDLRAGDEVLATDLEYGACDLAWNWVCRRAGARYVRAPIPLPIRDAAEVVDALFASASERTRAVYVSHVTSITGLVLATLQADYYSANAHKWLGAPKGAGFLHVRPEHQGRVDPAIVSWGYREGSTFSERLEKQGTRDPAAWLAVPDAIGFQSERDWDAVRDRCRRLDREARRGALRPPPDGADRAGIDDRADGHRPASPPCPRAVRAAVHASPCRDPPRPPRNRQAPAALRRRRLHDARRDRSALSRPRSGA
jgi:isopenicillin-N epimerase